MRERALRKKALHAVLIKTISAFFPSPRKSPTSPLLFTLPEEIMCVLEIKRRFQKNT